MNSQQRPFLVAENRELPLVLLTAFVLRALVFLLSRPWDSRVVTEHILRPDSDAVYYHNLALCIVNKFSFCGDTFRTPGYPSFMALFYYLFGAKPWIVLFAQIFVDLAMVYFVSKIGTLLFSRRAGIIAALFMAVDPTAIFFNASMYSDSLFVALFFASLSLYLRGLERSSKSTDTAAFAAAGCLCGLTILVRPVAQYYAIILILFAALWPNGKLVARLRGAVVYGLLAIITVSPWIYRNYRLYDTAGLSTVQGENLLFWQVAFARAAETGQSRDAVVAQYAEQAKQLGYEVGGNPFSNEAIAQRLAVRYIVSHPRFYAARWLGGVAHTFENLDTMDIAMTLGFSPASKFGMGDDYFVVSNLDLASKFVQTKSTAEVVIGVIVLSILLIEYGAAFLGSLMLIRRGQLVILALFVISILYFAGTSGTLGVARFRLPIAPFYVLIGAAYIDQLLKRREQRMPARALA